MVETAQLERGVTPRVARRQSKLSVVERRGAELTMSRLGFFRSDFDLTLDDAPALPQPE